MMTSPLPQGTDGEGGELRLVERPCPLCGTDNHAGGALGCSRPPWLVKQCAQCRFVYLEQAPAYEELCTRLEWEGAYEREVRRRRQAHPVLEALSSAVKRVRPGGTRIRRFRRLLRRYVEPGPLLDIGCGDGSLLAANGDRHDLYGIEISDPLATRAQAVVAGHGGRVLHTDAVSGAAEFADGFFAGITMYMYLEHELDPMRILAASRRLLAPGGRLLISVPNYASLNRRVSGNTWCGFRLPEHVNYFTPRSLCAMCARSGLAVVRCGFSDRLPISDSFVAVLRADEGA